MPVSRLIFVLMIFAAIASYADTVDVDRRGRRVQVDGFLLEWSAKDAREWAEGWAWDAVITPDGVSGYVESRGAPACGSGWSFGIAAESGAEMGIDVPGEPGRAAPGNIAFDRGAFDNEGTYTIEWLVTWDALGVERALTSLTITATSVCGDTLPSLNLRVVGEEPSAGKAVVPAIVTMVAAAGLTIVITVLRRRRITNKIKK